MSKGINEEMTQGLLTLLVYDTERFRIIREVVEPTWFITPYDVLCRIIYKFIDTYNENPASHIVQLVEDTIGNKDLKKDTLDLCSVLTDLWDRGEIRPQFLMDQLDQFIRKSGWRETIEKSLLKIQSGEMDEVEYLVKEQLKKRVLVYDTGSRVDETFLDKLASPDNLDRTIRLGIPTFDGLGIGLLPGELFLGVAGMKKGKTQYLIHLGKTAIEDNKKVLHISLEMSEDEIKKRYLQSFFGLTSRKVDKTMLSVFDKSEDGDLLSIQRELIIPDYLRDVSTLNMLKSDPILPKIANNLVVKGFSSGTLTISMLRVYLDFLIEREKFFPDLIIVDYADIMRYDKVYKDMRHDLGQTVIGLRGVAGDYKSVLATASQSNREGLKGKRVEDIHVAEDISKIATADLVVTYSQKPREYELGLARLYISNARRFESLIECCISQNYAIGQFCIDSVRMASDYQTLLDVTEA